MGEVFFSLLTLNNLLYMNIGLLGGIVVGALPGLTATMAVALLVPMTYGLDATTGILMLLGVYCGGTYGGSITAILINTPGTPAAAATAWDGHVLAKKGRAGEALEMALVASVFGGLFSTLVLMFVAPQIAKLALKFGPAEYFALAVFGLTIIASVSKSLVKGLIMGILGILATCIGVDPGTAPINVPIQEDFISIFQYCRIVFSFKVTFLYASSVPAASCEFFALFRISVIANRPIRAGIN